MYVLCVYYVCMYVCIYVCVCVCACTHARVHLCILILPVSDSVYEGIQFK